MLVKRTTPKENTFKVKGTTLAEILDSAHKNSPKGPGKKSGQEVGACHCRFHYEWNPNKDFEFETIPNTNPIEVKARLERGELTCITEYFVPKVDSASEKALSKAALKELKRWLIAIRVHEEGHAASFYALAQRVAEEDFITTWSIGMGADEAAAKADATTNLHRDLNNKFGGNYLSDLIQNESDDFDDKTDHGVKQGTELDTTIN